MKRQLKLCTCAKCGWVYMAYSRKEAEDEVKRFNTFYDTLTKEEQMACYGGQRSAVIQYEFCHCGSSKFRNYEDGDCPDGCTIGPVIWESKKRR